MTVVDPFALAADSAAALAERTGVERHDVAVILGSGWRPAADALGDAAVTLASSELPGFPVPRVAGHGGELRSVPVGDRNVLVSLGRVHAYEGHELAHVVHGVRTAVLAGCRTVVLTNAAGGISEGLGIGQPVLIRDHINLTGRSPLTGPEPEARFGPRFPDMTDAYAVRLRELARSQDGELVEGVYAGMPGPQYETPAEIRMLQLLGADLVGMSTVHETIAAVHLGAEVLGISLVTNLAAGLGPTLDHADVLAAAGAAAERMGGLLAGVVRQL